MVTDIMAKVFTSLALGESENKNKYFTTKENKSQINSKKLRPVNSKPILCGDLMESNISCPQTIIGRPPPQPAKTFMTNPWESCLFH